MTKTVIKLDPQLGTRLKIEAALRGIPMSALASAWIEAALAVQPPKGEQSREEIAASILDSIPRRLPDEDFR
jgi:hypothetical protein